VRYDDVARSKRDRAEKSADAMVLEARSVLAAYLPPESGIKPEEVIAELLAILENPEQPWFDGPN
jgi:hypothetical protein